MNVEIYSFILHSSYRIVLSYDYYETIYCILGHFVVHVYGVIENYCLGGCEPNFNSCIGEGVFL